MSVRGCGPTELPVTVDLPSGHVLEFRNMNAGDVDPMIEWYGGLDAESVYRRFFTVRPPGRRHFERLATIDDRGGICIVVMDVDPASPAQRTALVAEASYELLANGNGEMAITVEPRRRGWLGPYLFGLLCAGAAAKGVSNLEAEILAMNRPMRALSRARGEAFLPGSDGQTVRVVFPATAGTAPSWGESDGPRVLVEMRGISWEALAQMAASGQDVIACSGPENRPKTCPMFAGGDCPLAQHADAIVVALPPGESTDRLLEAHQELHGDVPVELVQRDPGERVTWELVASAAKRALDRQ